MEEGTSELTGLRLYHLPASLHRPLPQDIKACRAAVEAPSSSSSSSAAPAAIDEILLIASDEQLGRWRAAALSAVDALMLSDAPLQVQV